jgi:hypothetical protein
MDGNIFVEREVEKPLFTLIVDGIISEINSEENLFRWQSTSSTDGR